MKSITKIIRKCNCERDVIPHANGININFHKRHRIKDDTKEKKQREKGKVKILLFLDLKSLEKNFSSKYVSSMARVFFSKTVVTTCS